MNKNMTEKKRKKIGILGGTFNPIHYGHIHLAESAQKSAGLDQIMFIPSGISYMKNQREILSAADRMEMVKLAIRDYPQFDVSTIEIEKEGNSYSYETVLALKQSYPDVEFSFLTGADTIFSMESWKEPAIIFREVTILAAYRIGVSLDELKQQIAYLKEKYNADIHLVAVDHIDISSSEIRNAIKNRKAFRGYMPPAVEEYIRKNRLYQN